MSTFTISRRIDAPVETVFAILTDLENAAGRIRGIARIEILTPGPVGRGTCFRETRLLGRHEATEEMAITAFEPNRSFTISSHATGVAYTSTYSFQPEENGTLVTVECTSRSESVFARLMSPLGWLMTGVLKGCIERDLEDVRLLAEYEAAKV